MSRLGRNWKILLTSVVAVVLLMVLAGCPAQQPQQPENNPPTVVITSVPSMVDEATTLTVRFKVEDPDGDPIKYTVRFAGETKTGSVEEGTKEGKEIEEVFTAPEVDKDTEMAVKVIVNDGEETSSDEAKVIVKNINKVPEIHLVMESTELIIPADKDSVPASVTFWVEDDDGILSYVVKKNDETVAMGDIKPGEENKKEVEVSFDEAGDYNIYVIVNDGVNEKIAMERVSVIKQGNVVIKFMDPDKTIIGNKNDEIEFKIIYYPKTGAPEPAYAKWEVLGTEASDTIDYDKFNDNVATMTIASKTLKDVNAVAGKYYLQVTLYDNADNVIPDAQGKSDEWYYYPEDKNISINLTFDPTNTDATDNIYDGQKGLEFTVRIDGSVATNTLISKDFEYEINTIENPVKLKLSEDSFTEDSTIIEDLGDYLVIELPATFTFKVDKIGDATETDSLQATVNLELADASKLVDSEISTKKVDGKAPTFEIDSVTKYDYQTVTVYYKLQDANLKAATINFYIKDYDGNYIKVATKTLSSDDQGSRQSVNVKMEEKFDYSKIYYDYQAEDEVGHKTPEEVEKTDSNVVLDMMVKNVTVKWIDPVLPEDEATYVNYATQLTFEIVVEDKAGVLPSGIEITGYGTKPSTFASYGEFDEDTNTFTYDFTLKFASPDDYELGMKALEIRVTDNSGNSTTVEFPPATVVYDTVKPEITLFNVGLGGAVAIETTERADWIDEITIYATENGVATPIKTVSATPGIVLEKVDFDNAGIDAPDYEPVTLFAKIKDKAGNVGETDEKEFTLDVVVPYVKTLDLDKAYIDKDQEEGWFYIAIGGGTITKLEFVGGDLADATAAIATVTTNGVTTNGNVDISGGEYTAINGATEATITITFKDNVAIDSDSSITVKVYAKDDTHPEDIVEEVKINYEDLLPKKDDINLIAIVYSGAKNVAIYTDNTSTLTFANIGGADATDNSYGNKIYVVEDSNEDVVATETTSGTGAFILNAGNLIYKLDNWTIKNIEKFVFEVDKVYSMNEYVGDEDKDGDLFEHLLSPDYIIENYQSVIGGYWYLDQATELTIKLPVVDGVGWKNVVRNVLVAVDDSLSSPATEVTLKFSADGGIFNSNSYGYKDGVVTVDATLADSVSQTFKILNIYTGAFMDEYAYTVEVASALAGEYSDGTAPDPDATVIVATLTINLNGIGDILTSDINNVAYTLAEASFGGATSAVDNNLTFEVLKVDVEANIATVTIRASNDTTGVVTTLSDATILINKDNFILKFKPAGFTNGFWITNFSGSISN